MSDSFELIGRRDALEDGRDRIKIEPGSRIAVERYERTGWMASQTFVVPYAALREYPGGNVWLSARRPQTGGQRQA